MRTFIDFTPEEKLTNTPPTRKVSPHGNDTLHRLCKIMKQQKNWNFAINKSSVFALQKDTSFHCTEGLSPKCEITNTQLNLQIINFTAMVKLTTLVNIDTTHLVALKRTLLLLYT
jgi:hypothetical protein